MGTKHATRTLSGADLDRAVFKAISEGDSPAMIVVHHPEAAPGLSYYATRDPESFDGAHGSTPEEAKLRLFVFESFGDEVEL